MSFNTVTSNDQHYYNTVVCCKIFRLRRKINAHSFDVRIIGFIFINAKEYTNTQKQYRD